MRFAFGVTHFIIALGLLAVDASAGAVRNVSTSTVSIVVTPAPGTSAYAVEDSIPEGLVASGITEGGAWDAVFRKVKWGPWFDSTPRTLTYTVSGADGSYTLSGTASFDGIGEAVSGTSHMQLGAANSTAVRTIAGPDVSIQLTPATGTSAYAVEELIPVGLTVSGITQAGEWNVVNRMVKWGPWFDATPRTIGYSLAGSNGDHTLAGVASFDGTDQGVSGPAIMHLGGSEPSTSVRTIQSTNVCVLVIPTSDASAYAVEESIPVGLSVSGITQGGTWDSTSRKVKWGPFFDATTRNCCYSVAGAPGDFAVTGLASVDGMSVPTTGSNVITVPDESPPTLLVNTLQLNVRENAQGRFYVQLSGPPVGPTIVNVQRVSGDASIVVQSGASLTFTPQNWAGMQMVTLKALPDSDTANGVATVRCSIGAGVTPVDVQVTELDVEGRTNLALAASGSTNTGSNGADWDAAIDGLVTGHSASGGFGQTIWMNTPGVTNAPGWMLLDLKTVANVNTMRLLLWDLDARYYRYRVDASVDGKTWELNIVDASQGERRGWQDWTITRPVRARYLRLTGLYSSTNQYFHAVEWEVYGSRISPIASQPDLDGDRAADLGVFHAATGNWYMRQSRDGLTFSGGPVAFGWSAAVPVPGDYDGDGQADFAVYVPGEGKWSIDRSGDDGFQTISLGDSGLVPVVGDYDGDGRADAAVYRPTTADWTIRLSLTGALLRGGTFNFGWNATIPVPADYDGDGKTDIAVFWPEGGLWYVDLSGTGAMLGGGPQAWGFAGNLPVQGDYDGDGKSDLAIYDPPSGNWFVRLSSTGGTMGGSPITWGAPAAMPVPNDYDGDGKTDIAVYVAMTGKWYIRKSSDGTLLGGGSNAQNGGIPWGHRVTTPANAQYQTLKSMGLVP